MYTFLVFILFTFASCSMQKPVSVAHVERIEERVMPVAVGADTIEIVLSHTDNTEDIKTCLLGRDFAQQKQDHYVKEKSSYVFLSKNPTSVASQNNSSLRSTRPLSLQTYHTDTSTRIRLTLRPDTVYLPYTHHIRSDTIVVPDRICETKLQKTQTANVLLILILIIIFIFFLKNKTTR